MTMVPGAFKAYDVRGLYPQELDEEGAERIGRAFVEVTGAKRVAVGHDVRLSSPAMAERFAAGVARGGAEVVELGLAATEMVYFAVADGGFDAGAAITASHNPPQYTGMKLVREGALPLSGDTGIGEVGRLAADGLPDVAPEGARSRDEGLLPRFVENCLGFVDADAIRGLRVVLDAANGMAGLYLPPVLDRLAIDAVPCFLELDGRFPNHEPNPLLPENREFI
jgi:phosphomannomutase